MAYMLEQGQGAPTSDKSGRSKRAKTSSSNPTSSPAPSTPYYRSGVEDAAAALEAALSRTTETPGPWSNGPEVAPDQVGPWSYSANADAPGPWSNPDAEASGPWSGALPEQKADVEQARGVLDQALRAERVQAISGRKAGEVTMKNVRKTTDRMTWEEYNALTPMQRDAVDFNTQLTKAVKTDLKLQDQYKPDYNASREYESTMDKVFGAGSSSSTYAPETLALLDQLGYKDKEASLDDFLSLDAAITDKVLKDLKPQDDGTPADSPRSPGRLQFGTNENPLGELQSERVGLAETLARANADLQAKLIRGNDILNGLNNTARFERNADVRELGGARYTPNILGYGTSETDQAFQQVYSDLSQPGSDLGVTLQLLAEDWTPEEMDAFKKYLDVRSANEVQYGLELGDLQGVKYRDPAEFRKFLGLEVPGNG